MRNLKRALSLALASVMLLGMMVVGTSASYADVDGSNNQEAINVLQAVGIMTGDENGNFNPDKTVTRNEMAVVMVNLLGLKTGGTTPFTDVPAWAQPYVAACYNNGIIAGTSATTFGGSDSVTTVQAGLMVMKALGYFGYQGEFGQDWKVAVAKRASQINLYDGVETYVDEALTRNDVAQLVLNTLESTVVVVAETGGVSVSGSDVDVNIQGTYDVQRVPNTAYDYAGGPLTYQQLCEKLYGRNLIKNGTANDDLGRPAVKWTYKGKAITSADIPAAVYTDAVALKDVYAALNLSLAESFNIYLNGTDTYASVTLASTKANCAVSGAINANATDMKIGGKGYTVEFFVDNTMPAGSKVSAIAYTQFLAKASANYNANNESVGIAVKSNAVTGLTELKLEDFPEITSIKKDDYLLITASKSSGSWKALSVENATAVKDVTVSGFKGTTNLTAGGTTYNYDIYASNADSTEMITGTSSPALTLNDKHYDLYLNSNGYVIGVKTADNTADLSSYLFVKNAAKVGFNYIAEVLFMDGTTKTVTVSKVNDTDVASNTEYAGVSAGVLSTGAFYTFTYKSSSDKYELTYVSADKQTAESVQLTAGDVTPFTNSAYVATGDTVYIAKDNKMYVGVKNAPGTTAANYVYGLKDDSNFLLAVYAPAETGTSSVTSASDYVYVLGYDGTGIDANDVKYVTYNVIVNGEKTKMNFTYAAGTSATKGLYKVDTYEDGYAVKGSVIISDGQDSLVNIVDGVASTAVKHSNGAVQVGSYSYVLADDATIYTIDSTDSDKLVVLSDADQLNSLATGTYKVYGVNVSGSDSKIATLILVK